MEAAKGLFEVLGVKYCIRFLKLVGVYSNFTGIVKVIVEFFFAWQDYNASLLGYHVYVHVYIFVYYR